MATPFGHFLMGTAIGTLLAPDSRTRRAALVAGAIAAAPDLDFVPGLVAGAPARFHHGVTHSVSFALAAAGVTLLAARRSRVRWGLVGGLAYASHLLLDYFTLDDRVPYGIPLFWPVLPTFYQSPVTILPNVPHELRGNAWLQLGRSIVLEIALCGSFLAASLAWVRHRRRAHPVPAATPSGDPDSPGLS